MDKLGDKIMQGLLDAIDGNVTEHVVMTREQYDEAIRQAEKRGRVEGLREAAVEAQFFPAAQYRILERAAELEKESEGRE